MNQKPYNKSEKITANQKQNNESENTTTNQKTQQWIRKHNNESEEKQPLIN